MKNFRNRLALAVIATAATMPSFACGPDFPPELLSDRAGTLFDLPEGAFAFEARRLVSPTHAWTIVEHADWIYPASKISRESIERAWWGENYARIAKLRESASGEAAYADSTGLPEEVRLYIAGAVSIARHANDDAVRRFQAVLNLPTSDRAHYGVWAQFAIARLSTDRETAVAAFRATRQLVANGAPDPLGVAATSLGDEAKRYLDDLDDAKAVALYAEQTAAGSEFGRTSLLSVARDLLRDDARLQRAIADPLTQHLVTIYLFTRSGELDPDFDPYGDAASQKAARANSTTKVARYLAAIEKAGIDNAQGADRLAAVAYRGGHYDLATKLVQKQPSALADWVRAKLALRAGDFATATSAYAQAAKAFPPDEQWGSDLHLEIGLYDAVKPSCRIAAEQGTLSLARGDYVDAMAHLFAAATSYWHDAAYVAERVLTVDELKAFVDAHAPPTTPQPKKSDDDVSAAYGVPQNPATALRALLARRLLRAGRYDDALPYFDDTELRAKAQAYVNARHDAEHGDRIDQAQALYRAATSARFDGMEILGFELDPDFGIYGGAFDGDEDTRSRDAGAKTPFPLFVAGEDDRALANRAVPPKRFHYRYTATDLAGRSADLLPPRSQAFAAVLCRATGWLIDRDPASADAIYRRYVHQGPHVAWATTFGRQCPEPDFPAAAARLHAEHVAHLKHLARHALPWVIGTGAIVVVATVALLQKRRRRKRST